MKAFLVIFFSALASIWIARDTRRRRGAHKALNFLLLFVMGVWILFWSHTFIFGRLLSRSNMLVCGLAQDFT